MKVTLIDGPYKDVEVDIDGSGGLYMGGQLPDGTEIPDRQAYYRPTRNRSEYRFKGWVGEEEILRLPAPGAAA
jgi:hypothetical protein